MRNKKLSILAVLVMLVTITTYSVSGTYAKYTSSFEGTSTATIAKWDVKVGDVTNKSASNVFEFDLFKTIKDADGSDEDDVAADRIAPGTSGEFEIKLANNSEVNAAYDITFTKTGTEIPLEFTVVDGTDEKTGLSSITATPINRGGEATVTVKWVWPFNDEGDDTSYASLDGEDAKTVTVKADVTINQVD